MGNPPIRVGIVGANPERGWAADAHIPALRALPEYEITAVATTRRESADASAQALGVRHAFVDNVELARCPDVDLVAVNVKVPDHLGAVTAALDAGKQVWCEWPLGRTLAEAEVLAGMARDRGVGTVVGLQSRVDPTLLHVRDLVRDGAIGEVLSTTMVAGLYRGPALPQAYAYMADVTSGSNLLTVVGGHTIDALCTCLGELTELSATLATRRPTTTIAETGQAVTFTAPDQVVVAGVLEGSAIAAVHLVEGGAGSTAFWWEIAGAEGTLQLVGRRPHPGAHRTTVTLRRPRSEPEVITPPGAYEDDEPHLAGLAGGPGYNVARCYAAFAQGRVDDVADFAGAVRRQRTIATIEAAAASGRRQATGVAGAV